MERLEYAAEGEAALKSAWRSVVETEVCVRGVDWEEV